MEVGEILKDPPGYRYKGVDIDALIEKYLCGDELDIDTFKVDLLCWIRLADLDCSFLRSQLQSVTEGFMNQQKQLKVLNTKLKFETRTLSLQAVMKEVEEKALIALDLQGSSTISRRDLWREYFGMCTALRKSFLSYGLLSADSIAEIAVEVHGQISKTIRDCPFPTRLVVSVNDKFQPGHLPFIKALCDFMEIVVVSGTRNL